ncbi:MAG: hypothetical protein JWP25_1007, partial [Bradyrhizobium sp.]|nr:hypothetical protein [Bradyrhizobium sp.]
MPNADRIVDMVGAAPARDEVRVTMTDDALMLTGWKAVRITRSIQVATSSFELTCSASANTLKLIAKEGAPIKIAIGDTTVLSGFVETVENVMTARAHDITISGRGKCADMVDCSCRLDKVNANTSLITLCETIASSYSIDVFVPANGSLA